MIIVNKKISTVRLFMTSCTPCMSSMQCSRRTHTRQIKCIRVNDESEGFSRRDLGRSAGSGAHDGESDPPITDSVPRNTHTQTRIQTDRHKDSTLTYPTSTHTHISVLHAHTHQPCTHTHTNPAHTHTHTQTQMTCVKVTFEHGVLGERVERRYHPPKDGHSQGEQQVQSD